MESFELNNTSEVWFSFINGRNLVCVLDNTKLEELQRFLEGESKLFKFTKGDTVILIPQGVVCNVQII